MKKICALLASTHNPINMAENAKRVRYYTNPAFCQQSEYYAEPAPNTTTLTRCSSMREAPIGANSSPQKFERYSSMRYPAPRTKIQHEMDENELRINQQVIDQLKMTEINPNRYGYIPQARQHRYEMIPTDEEGDLDDDYETEHIRELSPNRVHYTAIDHNGNSPQRYAPIPAPRRNIPIKSPPVINQTVVRTVQSTHTTPTPNIHKSPPPTPNKYNAEATRKLQELIITPRKTPIKRSNTFHSPNYRAKSPPPVYPGGPSKPPYCSPPKYRGEVLSPRAQQKLHYTPRKEYRENTAVIQPLRAPTGAQSVYSETTVSGKSSSLNNSWMNLSVHKDSNNSSATLALAALMMILCGALTSGFCFYMISIVGRKFYLDFALVAGFTCFVLGLLGFRTRLCPWLPNRNYISGYIVLSVFSLITSAGLLVILGLRPRPGTPVADITSGAVCGISALTLLLASLGVLTSYCCKYPPPDNRVEHCAPGFTV